MADKRIEDLTDDEIAGMSAEDFAAMAAAEPQDEGNEQESDEASTDAGEESSSTETNEAAGEEGDGQSAATEENQATERTQAGSGNDEATGQEQEGQAAANDKTADKANGKVATEDTATASHEEQIKALYAPFKANGRDMQVGSVEEARQLMQMGANYNKKMQAMKPHLATLRTLENAKIGEAELNFLIDVHNRVPEAINKLVKDSGIDPMDLSPEKADGYRPNNHKPSDKEVELDSVLQELDGSAGLPKTINVVSKEWDISSRQFVAEHPQLLTIINNHIETGIYDQIAAEVDRERTFGRLKGLSDLEAYRQVGDAMNARGAFVAKGSPATSTAQQTATPQVIKTNDPKKADDSKRNAQKRGVAPVKGNAAAVKTLDPDFNPLSMSDEDFAKQFAGGKF